MTTRLIDSTAVRVLVFLAASACIGVAIAQGYRPWRALLSLQVAFGTTVMILGGLLATIGIRQIARHAIGLGDEPWYAGAKVLFLLLILSALVALAWRLVLSALPVASTIHRVFPGESGFFVVMALQLLWSVALDLLDATTPADIMPTTSWITPRSDTIFTPPRRISQNSRSRSRQNKTSRTSRPRRRSGRITH